MIYAGRLAGIPYFDIYKYTWGEVLDFIEIYNERVRLEQKRNAQIAFRTASLLSRMITGGNKEYSIMDEFDWLYTLEEHRAAKLERLKNSIHVKEDT